ncbi:MAG TPA: TRAP transporter substrate-binding protein [Noviherbaspirillum sp.]
MKFSVFPLALAALLCVTGVRAQEPITIKFSHVVAPDTPKGKAAERFRELAEKATRGRVRVLVYPSSQLYKDREELEALQLGAVQMLAPSLAKFSPLGVREFEVFDLPYIFPDKKSLYRVTEGAIGEGLLHRLQAKGIKGLAYWDNGFKVMSANRPLRQPADFRGLKMRIQGSRVLDAQMRALGASPLSLPFGEVVSALRSGVVDGTENPPSNFYTQNMQELQGHLTVSNHGYLGYAVIVNKKFWDGLPSDIRDALEQAMGEATAYANAIAQQENDRALEAVRRSGKTVVHVLSEQEKQQWRDALGPVHREMEARIGKKLLEAVRREIARP